MTTLTKEEAKELVDKVEDVVCKQDRVLPAVEQKHVYVMGNANPFGRDESGNYTYFSGADIISFFGVDMPEVLNVKLGKNWMEVRFALSPITSKIALSEESIDFNFIGVNEFGHCGLISGSCDVLDFKINMGIEELSTEITVYFDSKIKEIDGWLGVTQKSNDKIKQKFHELRIEYYKAKGMWENVETEVR